MFATVSYKENMFNMGHGAWLQKLISQIFCNIPPPSQPNIGDGGGGQALTFNFSPFCVWIVTHPQKFKHTHCQQFLLKLQL